MLLTLLLVVVLLLAAGANASSTNVTLAFMGDIMLGRGIAQAYSSSNQMMWEEAFAAIKPDLAAADLALANLESPITNAPLLSGVAFDLRAPPESLVALTAGGFDLLSIANNHMMDCGEAGLHDTQEALKQAGITPIGPSPEPVYRNVRGLTIVFIAFDDITSRIDATEAAQIVRDARKKTPLVIVSIHWGREYLPAAEPRQMELAQKLAEAGATIIWGHHPHVLQPVQWIDQGSRYQTLVAYSLGNLLFDQYTPPDAQRSAILWVNLSSRGVEKINLTALEIKRAIVELADAQTAAIIQNRTGVLK
jgi:poly-gamma-glutamate synthesis protein (capsule biosynthesis protein)